MKKVLIIAQYFPPAGGVGTFRVTKFVKFLRQYGWDPVVLTVAPEYYVADGWPQDTSLLNDLPADLKIYRTRIMSARLFNDPGIRWLPYLVLRLGELLKAEKPDLVYLTGDPFIPLTAAPIIRLMHPLRYIIDLRDPWKLAHTDYSRLSFRQRMGSAISKMLEPWVIRSSAKTICVSKQMCASYRKEYKNLPDSHFTVITNGYDPDDYKGISPEQFTGFTIVYTGKFETGENFRNPLTLFKSLKRLNQRGMHIRFVHVGAIEQRIVDMADDAGISSQVEFRGWLPYYEALAHAKGADLLLVLGGGQASEQTGKIFDYIACNRPILALANQESDISRIVMNVPHSICLDQPTEDTLTEALIKAYNRDMESSMEWTGPQIYDRRILTKKLCDIFNEVLDEKPDLGA